VLSKVVENIDHDRNLGILRKENEHSRKVFTIIMMNDRMIDDP
jgi:hypothetical protein